jgi:hypothetical protein
MAKLKRMTAIEALEFAGKRGDGYAQAELQAVWEQPSQPIAEIKSIPPGFTEHEARRLWNARPRNKEEKEKLEQEIRQLRISRGLTIS